MVTREKKRGGSWAHSPRQQLSSFRIYIRLQRALGDSRPNKRGGSAREKLEMKFRWVKTMRRRCIRNVLPKRTETKTCPSVISLRSGTENGGKMEEGNGSCRADSLVRVFPSSSRFFGAFFSDNLALPL